MSDYVLIRGQRIREWTLWAALGLLGFLLPVFVAPLWMLLFQFLPLMVLPVVALAWWGWRLRGTTDTGRLRRWAFSSWLLVAALWDLVLVAFMVPPGSDLPTGNALAVAVVVDALLTVAGSAATAVIAFEVARRRLAPATPA